MRAAKFLGVGAVGLFSDFRWPTPVDDGPGAWVGEQSVEACRRGIHACTFGAEMLDWIDDELWIIELEDPVELGDGVLLARRGRLIERIEEWDAAAARAFAEACEARAAELASPEFAQDAALLLTGSRPETGAPVPMDGPPTPGGIAANLGFVVAHAVAAAESERAGGDPDYATCFAAERAWQFAWFYDRLALSGSRL